ncbi:hypothetical protein [uncultured Pontibacter sp.]|uniref:hypothetical protein n=1 Tax=uncultured Pontibacter sp. TaxID=453356 RepID=UPI0026096F68|nr:hypothetical protein [uncultured Pontibacter sp.]
MSKNYITITALSFTLIFLELVLIKPLCAQSIPTAEQLISMYDSHQKGDIFQVKQYANNLEYTIMDKDESDRVFYGKNGLKRHIWAFGNGKFTFKDKTAHEGLFKYYYNQISKLTDIEYADENTFFFEFDDKTIYLNREEGEVLVAITPKSKYESYKSDSKPNSKTSSNLGGDRYTPKEENDKISFIKEYIVIGKTSTRTYLKKGDKVKVTASGKVSFGLFAGTGGPRGIRGFEYYSIVRNYPHGCLIATIGDGGTWHYIGNEATITADKDGFLKLYVNDSDPRNNTGRFTVIVENI